MKSSSSLKEYTANKWYFIGLQFVMSLYAKQAAKVINKINT